MLISRKALELEMPCLTGLETTELSGTLAMLGFPVDGVEARDGDVVLEVDVTANRGDVMSHRGLARDLAARLGQPLGDRPGRLLEDTPAGPVEIRLESDACCLYATALLELGEGGRTPEEVVPFLEHVGSGAKGLPAVDASNELLHRYGHPTHAFDADRLRGGITVRHARDGERLLALDGIERKLTTLDLVIADECGPVALAGLIGGEATKVTETTRRVLLESAYFDPRTVRLMARRHGLHTDASHRFGRGADPVMAEAARDLLVRRLMDWAGARLVGLWTIGRMPSAQEPIPLSRELLERIAGEPLALDEAAGCLEALDCAVQASPGILRVTPPSWRHDLGIPEDLAEEVLRIRGFERIPSALPPLEGSPQPHSASYQHRRETARRLAGLGFHQTVTFGFVSPEMDAAVADPANPPEGRTLANPLGVEYSIMRSSLLLSLQRAAEANQRQGAREVRLFEIAPVFRTSPEGPREVMHLGILWSGILGGEDYLSPARPVQKADLLGVLKDLGMPGPLEILELAPGMLSVEVEMDHLASPQSRVIPEFQPLSRFPSVERDVSLLVDLAQAYRPLEKAMNAAVPQEVRGASGFRCVDVFRGKSLPAGRQAWLMRVRLQAADRTLTSAEVDGWMAGALEAARALGAELRG